MYLKNGLFLCLTCLALQSCATFSTLPKNISPSFAIEGVYSNRGLDYRRDFYSFFRFDWKHTDRITVKVEIVNMKLLELKFYKNNEPFEKKRLKGKFKNNGCFYSRRLFYAVPLFPMFFGYTNERKRIYRVDDDLIIEITENSMGGWVPKPEPSIRYDKYNDILRFKQIED